jgi:hypothetical protein
MNKAYLIVPAVLLAAFVGVERSFQHKRAEEAAARTASALALKIEEDRVKAEKQRIATEELQQKVADRERADRERAEKKQRDYEAVVATLRDQAETQEAEAARLTAEIASLGAKLDALRATRNATDRETFDLARVVALQRVDRRNAEIELQRTTAMVAARLNDSTWANPSPSPIPAVR